LVFTGKFLSETFLDKYTYDCEKHDCIEEQDGKDGPQEGTKEYTRLTYEAAGKRVGSYN